MSRSAMMAKPSREFKSIIENAYDCCRKNRNKPWILEPIENWMGAFNGILFAKKNTPILGCAFKFTLVIDELMLSEPPRVIFEKPLFHPLISHNREFCFPTGKGNMALSCRSTPLSQIMDQFVDLFFGKIGFRSHPEVVNLDARKLYHSADGVKKFWAKMRELGSLEPPEEIPEPAPKTTEEEKGEKEKQEENANE